MKKVLIDTNFIITCVKQKIDFFETFLLKGIKIIIPFQVIDELTRLSKNSKNSQKRDLCKLSLKIVSNNSFESIDIGKGHVDKNIISFAKKNPKVLIATLDREIKNKTKNTKVLIKEKKILGFE